MATNEKVLNGTANEEMISEVQLNSTEEVSDKEKGSANNEMTTKARSNEGQSDVENNISTGVQVIPEEMLNNEGGRNNFQERANMDMPYEEGWIEENSDVIMSIEESKVHEETPNGEVAKIENVPYEEGWEENSDVIMSIEESKVHEETPNEEEREMSEEEEMITSTDEGTSKMHMSHGSGTNEENASTSTEESGNEEMVGESSINISMQEAISNEEIAHMNVGIGELLLPEELFNNDVAMEEILHEAVPNQEEVCAQNRAEDVANAEMHNEQENNQAASNNENRANEGRVVVQDYARPGTSAEGRCNAALAEASTSAVEEPQKLEFRVLITRRLTYPEKQYVTMEPKNKDDETYGDVNVLYDPNESKRPRGCQEITYTLVPVVSARAIAYDNETRQLVALRQNVTDDDLQDVLEKYDLSLAGLNYSVYQRKEM